MLTFHSLSSFRLNKCCRTRVSFTGSNAIWSQERVPWLCRRKLELFSDHVGVFIERTHTTKAITVSPRSSGTMDSVKNDSEPWSYQSLINYLTTHRGEHHFWTSFFQYKFRQEFNSVPVPCNYKLFTTWKNLLFLSVQLNPKKIQFWNSTLR